MAENKGKGVKGRPYDELSGVGTSQAGITGTTGNLNTAGRDGGVGMPSVGDAGNLQNADLGEHGPTPALGTRDRVQHHRQGGQQQNRQSGQGNASGGTGAADQQRDDRQVESDPKLQGGRPKR
jgi:hypothetical protein